MKRITPAADDRLAREFLAAARENDSASIYRDISPETGQTPGFRDSLATAVALLPKGPADTIRQVGANIDTRGDGQVSSLSYELHTPAGWGLANVVVWGSTQTRKVAGFRTSRLAASLEELNSFQRGAKHPLRLIVLALALCIAAFCLWVAVSAVRARIKRRWLWALFSILGVSPFILNWSTGVVTFQLLQIVLLSAGMTGAPPFGPWLITVAFPVGAIATLYRLRQERARAELAGAHSTGLTTGEPSFPRVTEGLNGPSS